MHDSVMAWVAHKVATLGLADVAVLDVGARDVNGTVRGLFRAAYTGLDVTPGRGVDVVADITTPGLAAGLGLYGAVVSTEALEHVRRPWTAVGAMAACTAPGGHLLLTCRGYDDRGCWPVHDAPDLWRFSRDGLASLVADHYRDLAVDSDPEGPGWFCHAWGPRRPA